MARRSNIAAMLGIAGLGYLIYKVLSQQTVSGTVSEAVSNLADDVQNAIVPGAWMSAGAAYIPFINSIENNYGIPTNLLARIAYQESHFRADIISGATKSSAGAVGMFQLLPQYFPGAGANWQVDADTAGKYLAQLYAQFGDWQVATGAYNDGPGNMQQILAGTKTMPTETENYVTQIFADVPVQGVLV